MKILYLCSDLGIPVLGRKGASVHVRGLLTAFLRAGHNVILAAPRLNKSPWERPAVLETPLMHVASDAETEAVFLRLKAFNAMLGIENSLPGELRRIFYNQDMFQQLKRRFENEPPDFIYERASLYATAGVSLASELNVPLLLELNAPLSLEQSAYRAAGLNELAAQAERWTLLRADRVLAVSTALRDYVVSQGAAPERVEVIPNGVDSLLFKPDSPNPTVKARWGLEDGPLLGFVGGLRPWHDVMVLPELLGRLVARYPTLRLVIAGDGPLRGELERSLRERGLRERVVFTGLLAHEEIAALIPQFDVALAPYSQLAHVFYYSPLKIFEYLACGAAVVAAGVGQIVEIVRDGQTGLLYPPGDLDALTAACDRLLADPVLRRRLGESGAKDILGKYTWDHNAVRVTDLAHSLIAARKAKHNGEHPCN